MATWPWGFGTTLGRATKKLELKIELLRAESIQVGLQYYLAAFFVQR